MPKKQKWVIFLNTVCITTINEHSTDAVSHQYLCYDGNTINYYKLSLLLLVWINYYLCQQGGVMWSFVLSFILSVSRITEKQWADL